MPRLSALRYAIEVQVKGNPCIGTKFCHHRLPLQSMRLYPVQAVNLVDYKVCNLVWHCTGEILFKVFGKYPGVIANTASPTHHFIHARRSARQIEVNRQSRKLLFENSLRALDKIQRVLHYLLLLVRTDWLYIFLFE